MSKEVQLDGFPEPKSPSIPPWGPLGRRFDTDSDVPVGVSGNPIPDSGFPTSRGFAENWDYEFTPNRQTVSSGPAEVKPLTIRSGTDVDLIQIVPGTVNSQYPTISAESINADPAPEITVSAAVTYVWIKCVGTFGAPDTYVLTIETTATDSPPTSPAISTTEFTTCFLIGYVTSSGGEITGIFNQYGGGNMGVDSFGSVNLWWSL